MNCEKPLTKKETKQGYVICNKCAKKEAQNTQPTCDWCDSKKIHYWNNQDYVCLKCRYSSAYKEIMPKKDFNKWKKGYSKNEQKTQNSTKKIRI